MFQTAATHQVLISVVQIKKHGLECYEVRVNGTLFNLFLSKQAANTCAQRWVNKTKGQLQF
jgi:hypothetical protein